MPLALCATGALALFSAGCRKEEAKPDPASPASYVHDAKFMGGLKGDRAKQNVLMRERNAIAGKMQAMVEAKKAELKTEDLKKVEAALEKDPAWRSLYVQCTNANEAVRRQRQKMLGEVKARLAPTGSAKKEISK